MVLILKLSFLSVISTNKKKTGAKNLDSSPKTIRNAIQLVILFGFYRVNY